MKNHLLILAITLCSIACANKNEEPATQNEEGKVTLKKDKPAKQEPLTYRLDTIDLISPENAESMKEYNDDDEYYYDDEEYYD
ncbi:MAG: hypothetical protein FWC39_00375 [Bacteroidetes bacterium]|nr:hypothetical protein [Bacteroidota bacterium]